MKLFTEGHPGRGGLNCALKQKWQKEIGKITGGQEMDGLIIASNEDFHQRKVTEVLNRFRVVYTEISKEQKAQPNLKKCSVPMVAAMLLKNQQQWLNTSKRFGDIPGVNVGDGFQLRAELVIIGLHHQFMGGIDYMKKDGVVLATSIVASGQYANEMESSDVLIYCGQGGNPLVGVGLSRVDDQKLERGNLALKNSMIANNPVRVIRGLKGSAAINYTGSNRENVPPKYIYDGLYVVVNYWQQRGEFGKLVFKFELKRMAGQARPRLTQSRRVRQPSFCWRTMIKSKNPRVLKRKRQRISSTERSLCGADVTQGKEGKPIQVVNAVDDEKLPSFNYINKMVYPKWYNWSFPSCCDCEDGCSNSEKCSCLHKNGGKLPFNGKGAIINANNKSLVIECGPACKCSSSCNNRVSQRGIRFSLEVFRTKSKGWGVRSRDYIPAGSFICEYVGEFIFDKDAERSEDGVGFSIDASRFSNVARFISNSCSPNLYAQRVLYDHDDKKAPHIMLFATKNIPPLREFTCDYKSDLGQICDRNGKVKIKNCYCGSSLESNRMMC